MAAEELLRIGAFSRSVGVSAELLRAWERRYRLLEPLRSPGGFRLYSARDAGRVARMRQGLDRGLSAAQAAQAALVDPSQEQIATARPGVRAPARSGAGPAMPPREQPHGLLVDSSSRLRDAIRCYDEAAAHAVLDESFETFGFETTIVGLALPALSAVSRGWRRDAGAIGREHFASNLIRARLLSLARLSGSGGSATAVLACPPGERHDISLIAFGLLLRRRGWSVVFLGADTPLATLEGVIGETRPAVTVIACFDPALIDPRAGALRRIGRSTRLLLTGPGATEDACSRMRLRRLGGDLLEAADAVGPPPRGRS